MRQAKGLVGNGKRVHIFKDYGAKGVATFPLCNAGWNALTGASLTEILPAETEATCQRCIATAKRMVWDSVG